MKLELTGIIAALGYTWFRVKIFWNYWSPIIDDVVKVIEEKAKDGVIDKDERKEIALKAIDLVAQKKGKKLGWLEKVIISKLIDRYAGKLIPHDIIIPTLIEEAKK